MTKKEIQKELDILAEGTIKVFEKNKKVVPCLFLFLKEQKGNMTKVYAPITFPLNEEKQKNFFLMGGAVRKELCDKSPEKPTLEFVIFISEGWYLLIPKDIKIEDAPMPSKSPDRKECVCITGMTEDRSCVGRFYEIIREKDKLPLMSEKNMEGIEIVESNLLKHFWDGFQPKLNLSTL